MKQIEDQSKQMEMIQLQNQMMLQQMQMMRQQQQALKTPFKRNNRPANPWTPPTRRGNNSRTIGDRPRDRPAVPRASPWSAAFSRRWRWGGPFGRRVPNGRPLAARPPSSG